jgi:hypothetical protein
MFSSGAGGDCCPALIMFHPGEIVSQPAGDFLICPGKRLDDMRPAGGLTPTWAACLRYPPGLHGRRGHAGVMVAIQS